MAQTYDIIMKQFNGVDYDVLLPKSADAVEMERVKYVGNETYGESNAVSVTFSKAPKLLLIPSFGIPNPTGKLFGGWGGDQSFIPTDLIGTIFKIVATYSPQSGVGSMYLKKSVDGKTFTWYSPESATAASNIGGVLFYCYGISGIRTDSSWRKEFLITSSGNFTIPYTGRYYLELHGGGGGYIYNRNKSGGGSGQVYNQIEFTQGDVVQVAIGTGGKSGSSSENASNGGETSFGDYNVSGGNAGTLYNDGVGVGNVGQNGDGDIGGSGGGLYPIFGKGGGGTSPRLQATNGAVFLKYLDE